MALEFKKSDNPTLGIELEIQLIDRESKKMAPFALPLIEACHSLPGVRMVSELNQSMVEINTGICRTVREAGEDLSRQIESILPKAEGLGIELAISGNHPFQDWRELKIYPKARYYEILEKFQWLTRRLTTFGLHVHVGIRDGDRAISVINSLINYIPHLLALSASSPFRTGADTGLASARVALFESFPTGGLPYFLVDWKEFQKCYDTLLSTGAIQSIKDIYWDIRPHFDFGTVEIRICDGVPTLREALALAALIQCLVVWLDDQFQKGTRSRQVHMRRYWLAPENKWQAARYGLEGQILHPDSQVRKPIREDLRELLEVLKPVASTLGCEKELSFVHAILERGSSATRQREVFKQSRLFKSVVKSLVKEFRENQPISSEEASRIV
jgi:carboxylate-amine ligase